MRPSCAPLMVVVVLLTGCADAPSSSAASDTGPGSSDDAVTVDGRPPTDGAATRDVTAESDAPGVETDGGRSDAPATGFGLLSSGLRDKTKWPFAIDSIWNTPIGSGAVYEPAGTKVTSVSGSTTHFGQDEDIIVMRPTAPRIDVAFNGVGWSGGDRCPAGSKVLHSVPVPSSFTIPSSGENNGAAFLAADGHTVLQDQPFTRCTAGGPATALVTAVDQDIYGPGMLGAHGGSGLSAIGGTLRVGELGAGVIHHALKVNLWAKQYYHCCDHHWPAITHDGYADPTTYGGSNPDFGPGTLLALRPSFDLTTLRTKPARILAQALIDYGAYVADDSFWNDWSLETELGPDGRVVTEFQTLFGFSMRPADGEPFKLDVDAIFAALQIVKNSAATSVGGGGAPRVALAPAIGN